jgi:hypothetical protein
MDNRTLTNLAIHKLCPDAEYIYENDDVDTIQWISGTNTPSAEQIKAMLPIVQTEAEQKTQLALDEKQSLLERLGITADEAALLLS